MAVLWVIYSAGTERADDCINFIKYTFRFPSNYFFLLRWANSAEHSVNLLPVAWESLTETERPAKHAAEAQRQGGDRLE